MHNALTSTGMVGAHTTRRVRAMDRGRDVACTAVSASLALLCLILLLAIDGLATAGVIVLLVLTFGFSIIAAIWGADLIKPGIWDSWAAPEDAQRLAANRAASGV